ncbi:MAG TPA: hypothetical protein VGQ57_22040, partial [Polyangiaceae bacterium]|nr:hypothetical protein [Polyangiaceae bacterium]
MKRPRSIEASLVSLGVVLGLLIVVLGLMLLGIERTLGTKLDRLGTATVPAQQEISGLRHAVSRLFERQVQVLSARSEVELQPLENRAAIEHALAEAQRGLVAALPPIVGKAEVLHEEALLRASTEDVLGTDAALFDSVKNRLSLESEFETRRAKLRTQVDALTQEARAVAGIAHLDYVLELRRVAAGASPDKVLRGDARVQQEAAGEVVIAVLQVGQVFSKIGGARSQDELNSIVANELAQSSTRARTQLRVLIATLVATDSAFSRASRMQDQLDALVAEVGAARDPHSLVELRRRVLVEATQAVELRGRMLKDVLGLSRQLEAVEHIVARDTQEASRSARRATWIARLLTPLALLAALAVGW